MLPNPSLFVNGDQDGTIFPCRIAAGEDKGL